MAGGAAEPLLSRSPPPMDPQMAVMHHQMNIMGSPVHQNLQNAQQHLEGGGEEQIYWPKLQANSPKMKVTFNEVTSTIQTSSSSTTTTDPNNSRRQNYALAGGDQHGGKR